MFQGELSDTSVDSGSRCDSLEGNWGSVSGIYTFVVFNRKHLYCLERKIVIYVAIKDEMSRK